jgi:protoporphyrinogen oxidase
VAKGHKVLTGVKTDRLEQTDKGWLIHTNQGTIEANQLINCIPLHELFKLLDASDDAKSHLQKLKYNSIYIVLIQVKKDKVGDHHAIYIADKSIIFHRLFKLNSLGESYQLPNNHSTLMAEVTFRPGSYLASVPREEIIKQVVQGLVDSKMIEPDDVIETAIRYEHYAYVIYDLDHRRNVDFVLNYLKGRGIYSAGRFATFEYLNTDGVVEQTLKLAPQINGSR